VGNCKSKRELSSRDVPATHLFGAFVGVYDQVHRSRPPVIKEPAGLAIDLLACLETLWVLDGRFPD
jgi:hypothetical protein